MRTKLRHIMIVKALETHPDNNSTETAVRMIACWARISQYVLQWVSKCTKCNENRFGLRKTVSSWPDAEECERLHIDWAYAKDQGSILVIVYTRWGWIEVFPMGKRISQAVKVYIRQIFANFRIPKALVLNLTVVWITGVQIDRVTNLPSKSKLACRSCGSNSDTG